MLNNLKSLIIRICCAAVCTAPIVLFAQPITRPIPFTFPTRDTALVSELPDFPAEAAGMHGAWKSSPEGHIVGEDGARLKLFGCVMGQSAVFLDSKEAETVAKRLRKFGFNAVRFEEMDYFGSDGASFFKYRDQNNQINTSSYVVNPIQLAKFDTLFSLLKKNGIYSVFTFHSGHKYAGGEGVMRPDSIFHNTLAPFLDPAAARLEREWARTFLTHVNPLTGIKYGDDPALAIIEYNNEASLYWYWSGLDRLIYIDSNNYGKGKQTISYNYSRRLDTLYSLFLKNKYGSDQGIRNAWVGTGTLPMGNFMQDGSFEKGGSPVWSYRQANGAAALEVTADGGVDSLIYKKIKITNLGGNPNANNISYTNTSARLGKDSLYDLTFYAKLAYDAAFPARIKRNIQIVVSTFNSGGTNFNMNISIDTAWKKYSYFFRASYEGLQNVQVRVGAELGDVWLDAFSIKARGETLPPPGEMLSSSTYRRQRNDGTLRLQPLQRTRDQIAFYDSLEKSVYASLDRLVRDTLKVKALINHRQNGYWSLLPDVYASTNSEIIDVHNNFDYVSSRPGIPYTDSTWMVRNNPMVKQKQAGGIPLPVAGAVKGKPIILGDYYSPWANQHHGEQFVLLPAWASYQDWDGIFIGTYGYVKGELFADSLPNFVKGGGLSQSIACDPTVMSIAPFASTLFRKGWVKNAEYSQAITHDGDDVFLFPTFLVGRGVYGVDGSMEQNIFTQMNLRQSFGATKHKVAAEYPYVPDTATKISDTKEMVWDQTNGRFTVTTPFAYAATGLYASDTARFPKFALRRTDIAANGKENISFYYVSNDDKPIDSSRSLLLAISTRVQNTGMVWADTLGAKGFGRKPTILAAPTVTCFFTSDLDSVFITPLDSIGRARAKKYLAVPTGNPKEYSVQLDAPQTKSMWYKIEQKAGSSVTVRSEKPSDQLELAITPNPVSTKATISFRAPSGQYISLHIFDVFGREIKKIASGELSGGSVNYTTMEVSDLPSGMYTIVLQTESGSLVKHLSITH